MAQPKINKRILFIGLGIAGLAGAYLLSRQKSTKTDDSESDSSDTSLPTYFGSNTRTAATFNPAPTTPSNPILPIQPPVQPPQSPIPTLIERISGNLVEPDLLKRFMDTASERGQLTGAGELLQYEKVTNSDGSIFYRAYVKAKQAVSILPVPPVATPAASVPKVIVKTDPELPSLNYRVPPQPQFNNPNVIVRWG